MKHHRRSGRQGWEIGRRQDEERAGVGNRAYDKANRVCVQLDPERRRRRGSAGRQAPKARQGKSKEGQPPAPACSAGWAVCSYGRFQAGEQASLDVHAAVLSLLSAGFGSVAGRL